MDTNLQCVTLNGGFVGVESLVVTKETQCQITFSDDVSACNSKKSEFLRLMFYNETT